MGAVFLSKSFKLTLICNASLILHTGEANNMVKSLTYLIFVA